MDVRIKVFVALLGLSFLLVVLGFVRSGRIKPSYSLLWLGVSGFLMSIPVVDRLYIWLAYSVIGITDARHVIYIGVIGFLLLYALFVTMKVSQISDQVQELVSRSAILEKRLVDVENVPPPSAMSGPAASGRGAPAPSR
jgi:hypothetical protein